MSSIVQSTIAPGLTVFDPAVLKTATGREREDQLESWACGKNPSIFVQWIPDEMTEHQAKYTFVRYGDVDRVEFVPKFDQNRKQIGRMLFVHFKNFFRGEFERQISIQHPEPHELQFTVNTVRGPKIYVLKCRINMRPIPKVEYTTSQLTDMFEGLNTRVMAQLADMQKQIDDLRAENQYLVRENTDLLERVDDLENGQNDASEAVKELFSLVESDGPFVDEVNEEDFDT
jgi:regulator of replication initiation timing